MQVSALDEAVCLDGLKPVVVSVAKATVIEATPSEVTVQLRVSQLFEEPGDSGVVVVYAHSEASDGGVLATDITHLVRRGAWYCFACTPVNAHCRGSSVAASVENRHWSLCGLHAQGCSNSLRLCVQAEISNSTSALAITRNATTGAASVALSNDVPVTACRCSQQLRATWEQCSTEVAAGDACACIDVPCATSMTLTPATADIACPDDEASQPPISLPTSTVLSLQLTYDDGRCGADSFPLPMSRATSCLPLHLFLPTLFEEQMKVSLFRSCDPTHRSPSVCLRDGGEGIMWLAPYKLWPWYAGCDRCDTRPPTAKRSPWRSCKVRSPARWCMTTRQHRQCAPPVARVVPQSA